MKTQELPRTSRRSFTRAIAAAIASIPFVPSLTRTEAKPFNSTMLYQNTVDSKRTHDTPPPLEIGDGSLRIESHEDLGNPVQTMGRFVYSRTALPTIEHIRVLRGNGDKIYEDLDAAGSVIDIEWKSDTPPVTAHLFIKGRPHQATSGNFEIDSDQRFPSSQQGSHRRPFRYQHPGVGMARRFRIDSIRITTRQGAQTIFIARPTGTGNSFLSDEFRVLIWRE